VRAGRSGWVSLVASVVAACLGACTGSTSTAPGASDAANVPTLTDFADGPWVLRVDRVLRAGGPDVWLPTQPLSESDYEPSSTRSDNVVVSMQGQSVSIGQTPFLGNRGTADARHVSFDLSTGTFSGGRFVVWEGQSQLQAELTLYGSGRPIVQSERGDLVRGPQ